ncbi:baseplate J/gp47 family protein [Rodentibacter trehalosifermentans]|uniref:baseplate J/gp47 family protein n=1 Tax=Rodentibacter trehalosifermentans TaxID=1908263 RepID=UPI000984FE25|nr:baseplate J/gp47 family protein [Rodentibacter trehalosifermentans]OOF52573.1 hypothetical protein BKK53_04835 [Rodentibacter trehalosifermentans]
MADYGVTSSGFVRKRMPEQLQELYEQTKRQFGVEIDLTPETILGGLLSIQAERFAALWELAEGVYSAMYPMSATGVNLDRAVSFTGVKRLQAEYSRVPLIFYGNQGAEIPENTAVRNKSSQVLYFTEKTTTVNPNAVAYARIQLTANLPNVGEQFAVTINGKKYSFQAERSSMAHAVTGLANQLKNLNFIEVKNDNVIIEIYASTVATIRISVSANLQLSLLGARVMASTEVPSQDEAEIGQVNELINQLDGIERVENRTEGSAGRLEETDIELYRRYHYSVWGNGAGTIDSLYANLSRINGVKALRVYENDTSTTQNGVPAYSIYAVVKGGLDEDVGKALLKYKPLGIRTHGSTTVSIKDSQNQSHLIRFSRPRKVYIWVKIVIQTFTDQGELAQSGYLAQAMKNVLDYGNNLGIGSDVILQRIIAQCVSVSGVNQVSVMLGKTAQITDNEPNYQNSDIVIAQDEEAIFDPSIITMS